MADASDPVVFYEGPVVSRAEAIASGSKFFFSGKPCHKGHIAQRYVTRGCVVCSEEQRTSWIAENKKHHKKLLADWYQENKERQDAKTAQWRRDNRERSNLLARRSRQKNAYKYKDRKRAWNENNRDKTRMHDRKRYHSKRKFDPAYLVHSKMRGIIHRSVKALGESKGGRPWESLVGYTKAELIKRLKKTLPAGYTWQDYLDGNLHIDHIVPCAAFNVTSTDDIDFRRAWALSNLQLLPVSENCSKGAKLAKPFQPAFAGI